MGLKYKEKKAENLFPVINEVISGKLKKLEIFGVDYDTKDGTCVRDYIHLDDIVDAHIIALNHNGSDIFNLGTDKGYSVSDIVEAFENVIGRKIPKIFVKRREGDPASLIADAKKAEKLLKWHAGRSLEEMVRSSLL